MITQKPERVLAIETSGATFSIALAEECRLVAEIFWHSGLTHSERLVPAIEWMLKETGWTYHDLTKLAVSTGPGSFTGIRVGLSGAQVISRSLGLPLVGLTSLEILRAGLPKGDYAVCAAIDALRGEVFVPGKKGRSAEIRTIGQFLEEMKRIKGKIFLAGNAAVTYRALIEKTLKGKVVPVSEALLFPRAGTLALCASGRKGGDAAEIKPLYVRRSWAEEKRPGQVLPGVRIPTASARKRP
ncbi:MAG: tRNA (adenosine(37)-N6)-threonylcarbamoyltransferase complex dimerization subunit type 1 TsaB [Endomicrobiales bacterium]